MKLVLALTIFFSCMNVAHAFGSSDNEEVKPEPKVVKPVLPPPTEQEILEASTTSDYLSQDVVCSRIKSIRQCKNTGFCMWRGRDRAPRLGMCFAID